MSRYVVTLTAPMVSALVDIAEQYGEEDSWRFDVRVTRALERRELVTVRGSRGITSLTKKGRAYLAVALWEWQHAAEQVRKVAVAR